MESCITNRLNSLSVLYCNLEKRVNDLLTKKELEEIKEIKRELKSIKELEIVNGELKLIKNNNNLCELRRQLNIELKSTPNYLEYTILYADFENDGICIYCPSEPYEPVDTVLSGPVIDNNIYTNLKNILNN